MKIKFAISVFLICFFYDFSFSQKSNDLIPYRKGNLWGYCDYRKKIIITPEYDDAGVFYFGFAWVKKGDKYGFINTNGELIIPCKYTWVSDFNFNGKANVQINNEKFEIDGTGTKVAPQRGGFCGTNGGEFYVGEECWNRFYPDKFSDFVLALPDIHIALPNFPVEAKLFVPEDLLRNKTTSLLKQSPKKWVQWIEKGCWNNDCIYPIYDNIKWIGGEYYLVKDKIKYGIINNSTEITIPIIYDTIIIHNQNANLVMRNSLWGVLDNNGVVTLPVEYDEIKELYQYVYLVKKNNHYGVFYNNEFILPVIYDEIFDYNNHRKSGNNFWVRIDNCWGIIDYKKGILLPVNYDEIRIPTNGDYYTNSLYIIKSNCLYGFVNQNGKIEIPIKYLNVTEFRGNYARVEISKNKFGYINKARQEFFED